MGNVICWLILIASTISALILTYHMELSSSINIVIWFIWLATSLILLYFTTQFKSLIVFVSEAKIELLKIVWPTRQETIQITVIVMIVVVLAGLILWGVDSGMMWIIGKITHLG